MANEPTRKDAGIVTAYGAAVRGGYTGTYEEFCRQQANYAEYAQDVEEAKEAAEAAAGAASTSETNAGQSAGAAAQSATAAGQSKTAAESAAGRAEAAMESYAEMTAEAETLEPGSQATAELDRTGNHPVLKLGLPEGGQGDPGVSPTVTVTDITGGHRVTITDAEGDHTFDVMNGIDGTGAVDSVNGKAGAVVLDGRDLNVNNSAQTPETIEEALGDVNRALNTVTSELFTVSDNLFDFDSIVENAVPGSIGSSPDTTITLNGWKTSNYIPVEAGQQYALILNGAITKGAIFRVACYANGAETYKSSAQESNPYTIPDGVDHIRFFSNTASLFATRTATSFKKYTADLKLAWTPYGLIDNFATKDAVQEYGVYVDGTNYYHFVRFGEQTLIRLFKQEGPNNLFQFSALYTGNVTKDGVNINQTIATNGTDTVGPISIMRQGIDSGGMWSGGWHTRTVNNVACPTAKQDSLDIRINGESIIGSNGLHYGECVATVVNSLYFPQTITGSDLSEATRAIEETVQYMLNDTMKARVSHKYVADTRVIRYYGLQAIRIGFDSILLPDNETSFVFNDMSAEYLLEKPEDLIQMRNSTWNYDLILKPYGLAKLTHNPGTGQTKYGSIPTSTRKVYWVLIEGNYDYTFITTGKVLSWEGEWHIYPN